MNSAALAFQPDDLAHMQRAVGHFVQSFQSRGVSRQRDSANDHPTNTSQSLHSEITPLQRPQSGEDGDDMHRPISGRNFPAPSKTEVRDKISTALRVVSSAKEIVRRFADDAAEIPSIDTAEGWRGGINIPGGYNLIILARQIPELRAVVRQLIDSDFDQDPRAYSLFIEAMDYARRRGK